MKLLSAILSALRPAGDPPVIDHAPVRPHSIADKRLTKARRLAAQRHGKVFHTHTKKDRETPPSDLLRKLQAKSQPVVEAAPIRGKV